jgi:hypothetical protein
MFSKRSDFFGCVALLVWFHNKVLIRVWLILVPYTSGVITHENHSNTQGIVVGTILTFKEQLLALSSIGHG